MWTCCITTKTNSARIFWNVKRAGFGGGFEFLLYDVTPPLRLPRFDGQRFWAQQMAAREKSIRAGKLKMRGSSP